MAFSIKNDEADELARRLAAATGESLTEAVLIALRERLQREEARRHGGIKERLMRLSEEYRSRPVVDDRSPDEIIGYDEHGLPEVTELVIDTSAAFAILDGEPLAGPLTVALDVAEVRLMSVVSLVELGMVAERRRPDRDGVAEQFVREAGIDVVAVQVVHADRAMEGWRRFGKGRHTAALNLGDCFTYALAIEEDLPILCVGNDFGLTDASVVDLSR